MIKAKSSLKIQFKKLSDWLGNIEITEIRNPYKNPDTAEVTTKLVVLARGKNGTDMYEVTVPGEIKENEVKINAPVDFENAVVTLSSRGYKGFGGNIMSEINAVIRVDKLLLTPKMESAKN